ncbi:Protein translocase subunit SecE [Buchnera aphidicola (Protaphis terricola)]|uniref:preprotein translocase subunit SecE n=1 Tax=Buchnera aphidicola TaxID=9 RepID=UPI003463D835
MNIHNSKQKKSKNIEKIKWIFISVNLILCLLINYFFNTINSSIRIPLIIFLIIFSIGIAKYTKKGKSILLYINASKNEMKKIIWPSYKETLYTTFIIIFVTIIISLLLWCLDSIIFHLITFAISLRL